MRSASATAFEKRSGITIRSRRNRPFRMSMAADSLRSVYFQEPAGGREPFAMLHHGLLRRETHEKWKQNHSDRGHRSHPHVAAPKSKTALEKFRQSARPPNRAAAQCQGAHVSPGAWRLLSDHAASSKRRGLPNHDRLRRHPGHIRRIDDHEECGSEYHQNDRRAISIC